MKAGSYPEGIKCQHKHRPAEPFANRGEHGYIMRITPSVGHIPAQAFVDWDGYTTWEKLDDLIY